MPANVRKTDLHLTNTTIFFLHLTKEVKEFIVKKNKLLVEEATTSSSSAEQTKNESCIISKYFNSLVLSKK